jgi:hypothetical protein
MVALFAAAKSFNHEGHEGSRRKTFPGSDFLRVPSCPLWFPDLGFLADFAAEL